MHRGNTCEVGWCRCRNRKILAVRLCNVGAFGWFNAAVKHAHHSKRVYFLQQKRFARRIFVLQRGYGTTLRSQLLEKGNELGLTMFVRAYCSGKFLIVRFPIRHGRGIIGDTMCIMAHTVYTIGYEKTDIEPFVATLQEHGITELLDVRFFPLSHKPGFSKTPLGKALEKVGITYTHMKPLGLPKELREERDPSDPEKWKTFTKHYEHILDQNMDAVHDLAEKANDHTVVLMCFERDWRECHRSILCKRLESVGLVKSFDHIKPPLTHPK